MDKSYIRHLVVEGHRLDQGEGVGTTSRVPLENLPPAMHGVRSTPRVSYTDVPPTPRASSTPGLSNNVRRRLSSPGPSRFLSPSFTVPQPRQADLGRESGIQLAVEEQGAGLVVGQKSISRKHVVLWCPRLRKTDNALCIEGQLLDENIAISERASYSTRVMIAKGSHIRVHGRSGTEYILEGKVMAKETSFPDIFHSINNTPAALLNR